MKISTNPVQYIFDNAGKIIAKLAGISEAEAEGSPMLDPITGFLALFADIDIGSLITDLGSNVIELLNPQKREFYLGLTGIETTMTPITLPVPPSVVPIPVPYEAPEPTIPKSTEKPTYPTPEEVLAKLKAAKTEPVKKTRATHESMTEEKSVMVINEDAVIKAMNRVTFFHTAMTIVTCIICTIVEVASLGQVDNVLRNLQSLYSLMDESGQFFAAQGARIDIAFERPYRYWLESCLVNNVPPPGDLGRFLARETLSPEDYTHTMRFWGFSDFWSDIYRRSRFIELPAETIFKALHYGELGEGEEADAEVLRLLRIADYNPDQVPLLQSLALSYPNRTELRLMARRSSIPRELVASALDTSGLRPEYQPYLIETLDNWNVDRTRNAAITEAVAQFERGFIDDDRLVQILVDNEASEGEAIQYQSLAILRRDGRRKQDRVKTIRLAFRYGLLQPSEEYQAELTAHMPEVEFKDATETDVYKALMTDLGFNLLDIELMLDDDRVRSKNIEVIESLDELLGLLKESEP